MYKLKLLAEARSLKHRGIHARETPEQRTNVFYLQIHYFSIKDKSLKQLLQRNNGNEKVRQALSLNNELKNLHLNSLKFVMKL